MTPRPKVDLRAFGGQLQALTPVLPADPEALNRRLFHWLQDDGDRAALFDALSDPAWEGTLNFPSRSALDLDPAPPFEPPALHDHVVVTLITSREDITFVLRDSGGHFSNRTYRALGAGNFMLGLDPGAGTDPDQTRLHTLQRQAAWPQAASSGAGAARPGPTGLKITTAENDLLVALALEFASTVGLAQRPFDLTDFSREVALRYCGLLFGFAASDHGLLRDTLHQAYRGMSYQMFGRHFVGEPDTLPQARAALATLSRRVDALIRRYAELHEFPEDPPPPWSVHPHRHRWPEGVDPVQDLGLPGFTPLLKGWAEAPSPLSGQQITTLVVGLLAGIVGNVQASVCIAIDALLGQADPLPSDLKAFLPSAVARALEANPPAPFLPRLVVKDVKLPSGRFLPAGRQCILAIGGGTARQRGPAADPTASATTSDPAAARASVPAPAPAPAHARAPAPATATAPGTGRAHLRLPVDPLVFGLLPDGQGGEGLHWCLGAYMVWPLIEQTARHVLTLPGLARRMDPADGEPLKLEKRWGFACEQQPLEYRRDRCRVQQPLQVVMRIKTPVAANAARLRQIIRDGAPKVERALRQARHVHFAWFQLIDDETHLALQTVYDGDFDAYIQHFALQVDDLFDQLFECIEGAPPLPVSLYPEAFVETIRRFHRPPLGGYFFSAYPAAEVWNLLRPSGPAA